MAKKPARKKAARPPVVSAEAWLATQLRKPGVRAAVAKIVKAMEAEERAYKAKQAKRRTR